MSFFMQRLFVIEISCIFAERKVLLMVAIREISYLSSYARSMMGIMRMCR